MILNLISTLLFILPTHSTYMGEQVGIKIEDSAPYYSVVVYSQHWTPEGGYTDVATVGRDWNSQWYHYGYWVVDELKEDSLVCYSYQGEYADGSNTDNTPAGCVNTRCH